MPLRFKAESSELNDVVPLLDRIKTEYALWSFLPPYWNAVTWRLGSLVKKDVRRRYGSTGVSEHNGHQLTGRGKWRLIVSDLGFMCLYPLAGSCARRCPAASCRHGDLSCADRRVVNASGQSRS
jgi:hypothetical protein